MNVLVTGASGFIGHNVLLRAPRNWNLTAVYHSTHDLDTFVSKHGLTNVRPVQCDLTSHAAVAEFAREHSLFDACLHLAANGDPAKSAARPGWDLTLNTLALVTLLEHVRVGHFVYVSSGAVYDGLAGVVTPRSTVQPTLPYAILKLASEHYVRSYAERRGAPASFVNVRFFGAFGPYEPLRKITTRFLTAVMRGDREFTLRGDGRNLIDFMYVDDAVDGFLALVKAQGARLTVDFASGAPVSIDDIVAAMASTLGVDVSVRHEGTVPEYIEFRSADTTMRDRFGVTPAITFAAGLQRLRQHLAPR